MRRLVTPVDRARIGTALRRDVGLHLYEIGDLDDFFWPRTRWYAWESADDRTDGGLGAIALLYDAPALPVLLALHRDDPAPLAALLDVIAARLPSRLYAHLGPGLAGGALANRYTPPRRLAAAGGSRAASRRDSAARCSSRSITSGSTCTPTTKPRSRVTTASASRPTPPTTKPSSASADGIGGSTRARRLAARSRDWVRRWRVDASSLP